MQPAKTAYHHGNLREALIEVTIELLDSRAPSSISLREIARLAGVSPAAPYRHFADKEALIAAVAERGFDLLAERMRAARDTESDAVGRLLALGLAYAELARERPAHYRVMFEASSADPSRHPSLAHAADATAALLRDGVAEGQRAGVVRDGDPATLSLTVLATAHGLASLFAEGRLADIEDPAEVFGSVLGTLFVGLARPRRRWPV